MRKAADVVSRWLWLAFTAPTELPRHLDTLRACLVAERERWSLWLPVLFGAGVAAYFALSIEPPAWLAPIWCLASIGLIARFRRHLAGLLVGAAMAAAGAGFFAIQWRVSLVAAPVIAKRIGPVALTGRVLSVEDREVGYRATIRPATIGRVAADRLPARVRVTVRQAAAAVEPGDWIELRAILSPPPAPSAPGAFDFQRHAWFMRLGAVGFAVSPPRRVAPPAHARDQVGGDFRIGVDRLRRDLSARIRAARPGAAGAVAAALMTGDRGAIPAPVIAAMRDSGLAHLLAISGLHMGLLAGFLFIAVRGALALWEWAALAWPIKKWAAMAALVGAFGYLLLAGATIPTQRAFVMCAIVLVAVMVDRRPISMRLVAWAAVAVLVATPEAVLNVSFQMSFAAVVALVAVYETWAPTIGRWRRGAGWLRRGAIYLFGVALTTLIAGLATGVFAVYHFNRFVDYGLIANLVAVPVMGFWIMPMAVVTFVALPLGLEQPALAVMGGGIELVIGLARTVSAWPGAVTLTPAWPAAALVAVAAGGLWLCLWRGRWRRLGIFGIAGGLAVLFVADRPDILISGDGKLIGVRAVDGGLMVSERRGSKFARETWLRRDGLAAAAPWPERGASGDGRLRCDTLGCIYRAGGWVAALPRDAKALAEDCRVADLVVSAVPVRGRCPSARLVIDRFDLWRDGAHAIRLGRRSIEWQSVNRLRGNRPWVLRPGAK